MISTPADYDRQQVDRLTGRLTLQLPAQFRAGLDAAIEQGLPKMPRAAANELKNLIAAQIALTLRASNFSEILTAELQRESDRSAVHGEAHDWERLNLLKNKHSEAVEAFEAVMYHRRTDPYAAKQAHTLFIESIELIDPLDSDPLKAWADRIISTRKKLRCAS